MLCNLEFQPQPDDRRNFRLPRPQRGPMPGPQAARPAGRLALDEFLAREDSAIWEILLALHLSIVIRRIWCVQELSPAADECLFTESRRDEQPSLFNLKMAMSWIRKRLPL